ncbi:hypothetical protein BDV95DRAFT_109734 [Massariosphaeria phaeospora]|uniref:Uncharacterized protein n=1 Tax=Massariosphaeria phaeospora TaxID=100035 RepID=A0A7C8I2C1_9PLEO|nr:hypothetical protein BDV95DRAFT_109734 [Massariosphaeria phaeospora]
MIGAEQKYPCTSNTNEIHMVDSRSGPLCVIPSKFGNRRQIYPVILPHTRVYLRPRFRAQYIPAFGNLPEQALFTLLQLTAPLPRAENGGQVNGGMKRCWIAERIRPRVETYTTAFPSLLEIPPSKDHPYDPERTVF